MTNKIFNDNGELFIITNLTAILDTFITEELEAIFKVNKYYHELNMELNLLTKLGYLKESNGLNYDPIPVLESIDVIEKYIINDVGEHILRKWEREIDYDWKKNRPEILNK